jgi:1-acyl-sn-glycerol-3-phosphate acyltransferase
MALFGRWISQATGRVWVCRLYRFWLNYSIRLGVFDIQFPDAEAFSQIRGCIIAANHPTVVDAILLMSSNPHTVCIMRASLAKNRSLGGVARLAGYVTNDCGPALIHQGVQKIQNKENLLIFPEGTRTTDQAVNPFKNGFALIASRSGAPIQTVFIEREAGYLGKGVSFFSSTPLPIRFRLHLGEIFQIQEGESAKGLAARLEDYFRSHLVNGGAAIRLSNPLP